jgi:NTP pyrophosphatase (non-canonical NTP hydrolase)
MNPNEYQKLALSTEGALKNTPDPRLLHGALGICTEAGELQDQIKRHLFYGKELDHTNIMEECGDLLWYVAITLDAAGFTMEDAMERNIAKLRARYPDKVFNAEQALVRDTKAENRALIATFKKRSLTAEELHTPIGSQIIQDPTEPSPASADIQSTINGVEAVTFSRQEMIALKIVTQWGWWNSEDHHIGTGARCDDAKLEVPKLAMDKAGITGKRERGAFLKKIGVIT